MFASLKTYVSDRRAGITKTAGFVGGLYLAKLYISNRLDEVKARIEQERAAKDSLNRRFQQTQDDVSYTVLALLPTLGDQILENMDVEAITKELQARSKARNARQPTQTSSSLSSSIDVVQEHDVRSENESVSVASTSFSLADAATRESSVVPRNGGHASESAQAQLSQSIITATTYDSSASRDNLSLHSSQISENLTSSSVLTDSSDTRTKAELWNEVKMLTVTRTLTTLYSTTLLCLLTTIQLTLLARAKYVNSVLQQERDERVRERLEAELSLSNLLFGNGQALGDLMSQNLEASLGEDDNLDSEAIPEDVESKYLTLSWWLLHVGWKDVGERVRRGVEEVFDGVSLKTKLNIMDFHRLISDVRRRVEHEITFEGTERRINFLSTLLPPTPEMVQHVLTQGGFPAYTDELLSRPSSADKHTQASSTSLSSSQLSHSNYFFSALNNTNDPFATFDLPFTNLLNETRSVICSSDFALVLENCLDRAADVLFDGLEKNVFVDSAVEAGEEVRIRLAGLLPGLSRWSSLALRSMPCELVDNVFAVREVPCLSAITFAKFEDKFR
ncbi:Peroxisomal biogenesis factor 3 [Leucoagaricus sp. SymC.cos]|nr:Peroxisomal biogenesis factor 3 [Leucoagaricus sp. SymC.cos]